VFGGSRAYVTRELVRHALLTETVDAMRRIEAHILFVDDEPDIRELVQVLFEAAGFRVSTADNAQDALKLAATERFDAILLDNLMPQATGVELCREIRSFDQITPILICSGSATFADREAAVSAGAQGYVAKPFNATALIQAVGAAVQSREMIATQGKRTA